MTPERYQQIDEVFQSALERDPSEREAFLDHACAGDRSLRREVEALIDAHQNAGSFIEAPVFEAAAELVAGDARGSLAGKTLGPYRIISELGAGGMGEVYLAQDGRLGRKVALKLLPAYFTENKQRLRRFQQEARAVSALNHPNIITIFDIGQSDSIHFLATEYIEGGTIRQRLASPGIGLAEALDIAIQTAGALDAAHQAGIVHRDIKPENIMLRRDGYVKVLDFGLAKMTQTLTGADNTQAVTVGKVETDPGTVVGTASYMSPEQARGLALDARTDTFSLGVVLYEMIAGRAPFEANTTGEVIALILGKEPAPLARYSNEVPDTLQWIVTKALTKEREDRYQTAREMLIDLRRLRQKLEFDAERQRSTATEYKSPGMGVTRRTQIGTDTAGQRAKMTGDEAARKTSSAEIILGELKRHRRVVASALVLLIVLIAGAAYWAYTFVSQNKPSAPFQTMKVTKLTTTGRVTEASISPDGKYSVYVMDDAGGQSIWIKHLATSSNVQIAPPIEAQYAEVTFSPDGNYVYYTKQEESLPANSLFQVPVLGGVPKKLTERVHGSITFSPDGKRIAFARWRPGRGEGPRSEKLLIVMNSDGTGEQKLTSRWTPEIIIDSAWSRDGNFIVCSVENISDRSVSLIEVRVADGTDKLMSSQKWYNTGRLAWLPDGTGLILAASDSPLSPPQLWRLSYPGGEARRITNDLNGYSSVSVTADSKALVTVQSDQVSNIFIAPAGDASKAKQITFSAGRDGAGVFDSTPNGSGRKDGGGGLAWTPDGKIVYHSLASGKLDLWMMNADGSGKKQLTSDAGPNYYPFVSADGRYIFFQSDRTGSGNVWRIDVDGGNPVQLTTEGAAYPSCSPDGKWIVYSANTLGRFLLFKMPSDGGAPALLTNGNDVAERPLISPDGRLIACNFVPPGSDWQLRIAALSFESGKPEKAFETFTIDAMREIRWSPDSRALTYVETQKAISNIWAQSLEGGSPVQLTGFKSDRIFSWEWSRDGKQLAVARGGITSDVVLISDFR